MEKRGLEWKIGVEELILFSIIILNLFDAAEILPSTLDYIKKIISWAALGYVIYSSKPTKIVFGVRNKFLDFLMIIGYFFILIKDLTSYALSSINESSNFLRPFFTTLITNQTNIETFGIIAGLILILAVCINMILEHPIKGPSIMQIIHEEGDKPHNFKDLIHKTITSFLVLIGFYLVVFNLIMEWLAIAIDAPILIIGIVIFLVYLYKHKKEHMDSKDALATFGDFGSSFYKKIIQEFTYKKTILRSLFAMLVLHILTEVLHYIWPYVLGVADPLYFNLLNSSHPTISQIFMLDSVKLILIDKLYLIIILLGNLIAILFLLITPGYLWYLIHNNKKLKINGLKISIIISSIIIFILSPAFKIKSIINQNIAGVDIAGQSIIQNSLIGIFPTVLIALTIGIFCAILSKDIKYEIKLTWFLTIISQLGFSIYILLFSFSVSRYYIKVIVFLINNSKYLLSSIMIIFFIISVLFYAFGTYGFLKDSLKHSREHLVIK